MNSVSVCTSVLAAHDAGLCVIPTAEDGTKRPFSWWRSFRRRRPTLRQLLDWYEVGGRSGLFVVCGAVSGDLEALDFDDFAVFQAFVDAAYALGLGDLIERIRTGYEDASPSTGRHWLYFCAEIGRNVKLAERPRPDGRRDALIEVRGEGGGVIVAPSHGRVHPTGRPYRLLSGGFGSIARIDPDERRALFALARSFTEVKPREERRYFSASLPASGTRPGDDYNARGDVLNLLRAHGWTPVYARGGEVFLRRPGKDWGVSATFGHQGKRYFYPFTSSTAFDPDRGYSPFAVYAVLEHGGDVRSAARALAVQGFGCRPGRLLRLAPRRELRLREARHA